MKWYVYDTNLKKKKIVILIHSTNENVTSIILFNNQNLIYLLPCYLVRFNNNPFVH